MKALATVLLLAASACAQLPNAPEPRVIDKKFLAVAGADLASSFTDAYLSHKYVHPEFGCHEGFFLLGSRPSAARDYGIILGMTAGVTVISYWLKRKFRRADYWAYPLIGEAATHSILIGDIMHNCHR